MKHRAFVKLIVVALARSWSRDSPRYPGVP